MSKKVFISYAWGEKQHQDWVVDLGKRLIENTVDVILDRWSLKDGHDVHAFMESMVKSNDIDRVLIVCDKNYKDKADKRDGGVGTETQIITPSIYNDQKQEKFVPLLIEKDDEGKPLLPIYLASRKYIDFSNEEYFESSYEELLRNILEVPSIAKPKIGTSVPLYITESVTNNVRTHSQVRVLEAQLRKNPEKVNTYFADFIEAFLETLWDFEFSSNSTDLNTYGEELYNNLLSYKVLRDDFIDCLSIVLKSEFKLDIEILIDFFEESQKFKKPKDENSQYIPVNYDNFKIIFHELFIYTIAVCIKSKNYTILSELFLSRYYISDGYKTSPVRFTFLYNYSDNFENYFRQKQNKMTGFGHYAITNLHSKIIKEDFILADILCYYIGDLFKTTEHKDRWFPVTYIYKTYYISYEFFEKFSSLRHFEKVKGIFDVNSPAELKKLLEESRNSKNSVERIRFTHSHDSLPYLHEVINIDTIGENR